MTEQQTTVERASGLALEHRERLESQYRRELGRLVDGDGGWTTALNTAMRGLGLKPEDVEADIQALEQYQIFGSHIESFDETDYQTQQQALSARMAELNGQVRELQEEMMVVDAKQRHLRAVRTGVEDQRHRMKLLREGHPRLFPNGS